MVSGRSLADHSFQRESAHYFGYVYFRQVKDSSVKRGYFQKVSHVASPCGLSEVAPPRGRALRLWEGLRGGVLSLLACPPRATWHQVDRTALGCVSHPPGQQAGLGLPQRPLLAAPARGGCRAPSSPSTAPGAPDICASHCWLERGLVTLSGLGQLQP